MAEVFEIATVRGGDTATVVLRGELDLHSAGLVSMRQRSARACALFGRLAQRSSVSRSSSVSTIATVGLSRRAVTASHRRRCQAQRAAACRNSYFTKKLRRGKLVTTLCPLREHVDPWDAEIPVLRHR